ncbi:hypothetical protein R3W88_033003 [Solanum pinnatisectum]|uniref:Retrotransposon gag domain-containing protein n=1 Tax=Solanum pinnatisectum TaxID=50273 RepID=A0AAV9K2A6_9SOLN|nr:hypothetical protein R3W88_033003 [Solanum pinnatisectum]
MENMEGQMVTTKGSVSKIDDRMNNVEGQINSTNSTLQANFRKFYGDQGGNGGCDVGINSINNLPPFKGECNPNAYLEWESLCERIFQVNDLTEVKKSCFAMAQFEGFGITWWEYMKRYHSSTSRWTHSNMDLIESPCESQVCAGKVLPRVTC